MVDKLEKNLLKEVATPFLANVVGYNPNRESAEAVTNAYSTGGLLTLFLDPPHQQTNVSISIPFQISVLTALHLQMKFTAGGTQPSRIMYILLSKFGFPVTVEANPGSNAEIVRQTEILTGPWTFDADDVVDLNLDLLPLLKSLSDDSNNHYEFAYMEDPYFKLTIVFDAAPEAWAEFEKFWVWGEGVVNEQLL